MHRARTTTSLTVWPERCSWPPAEGGLMIDQAHGLMIIWNFSIREGSVCMAQSESKDADEIRQFVVNKLGCGTDLSNAFDERASARIHPVLRRSGPSNPSK